MSVSIVVNDARLEGRTPLSSPSFMSLDVDEATPLDYFLNRCQSVASQQGGISTLYILTSTAETGFAGESSESTIIFCQETVHLANVSRFAALAGHVDEIVLLICARAATSFDIEAMRIGDPELAGTSYGDGDELCRQMAIHAKAKVTGAREARPSVADEHSTTFTGSEVYCEAGVVDFGEWQGTIVRYDAEGRLFDEWTNSSPWRDSHGMFADPRLVPPR
jgi:hypothetical protein